MTKLYILFNNFYIRGFFIYKCVIIISIRRYPGQDIQGTCLHVQIAKERRDVYTGRILHYPGSYMV